MGKGKTRNQPRSYRGKTFLFFGIATIFVLFLFLIFKGNALTALLTLGMNPQENPSQKSLAQATVPEIAQIKKETNSKLKELVYRHLIERVGPVKAQEDLYRSGLPFDGETHLLNHTVGDWLYAKYGTGGLVYCKDYFLSSCYHGFVIRAVADKGVGILSAVMQQCESVGRPTATQCAHAIGHGMLAYEGYRNLTKALTDCDNLGQTIADFPVYNCHDGIFMENIFAVHDDGKPSPDRWVNPSDPVYPCDDPRIGAEYTRACWSNQPMLMFQQFHGDIRKVSEECLKLSNNKDYQWTCFDALARQIHPMTEGNVNAVFALCGQVIGGWGDECVRSNVRAFFSVGDRKTPFLICDRTAKEKQNACFNVLVDTILAYDVPKAEKDSLCAKVPDRNIAQRCKSS